MIVQLVEIYESSHFTGKRYELREVFINPEHVVCLRESPRFALLLQEGLLPEGIDQRQGFTTLQMNRGNTGLNIVVVGSPQSVEEKIRKTKKTLLKG